MTKRTYTNHELIAIAAEQLKSAYRQAVSHAKKAGTLLDSQAREVVDAAWARLDEERVFNYQQKMKQEESEHREREEAWQRRIGPDNNRGSDRSR